MMEENGDVNKSETSLKDAFWNDPKYSRASWVSIAVMASVWLNGF